MICARSGQNTLCLHLHVEALDPATAREQSQEQKDGPIVLRTFAYHRRPANTSSFSTSWHRSLPDLAGVAIALT